MELVNPLTALTWNKPLDIHGVPMLGVKEKQGISFSAHGWRAARADPTLDADKYGAALRRTLRPLSAPTLERARADYQARQPGDFPRYFIIEPINVCNRACPFCSINVMERYDANGKPIRGMMEWSTFAKLMVECGRHAVYGLSLYQLGEPFLWHGTTTGIGHIPAYGIYDEVEKRLDISDMVRYAKTIGGFRAVNLSTNGDVANLACVLDAPLDDLIISIDGVTAEVYDANRPSTRKNDTQAFSRTLARVREFLAEKVRCGAVYPFVRLQIINKKNTAPQIVDFIREWIAAPGVDDVFVKNLDSMRPWLGTRVVSDVEDRLKAARLGAFPCQHIYAVGSMVVDGTLNACCHDARTELTDRANIKTTTFRAWWNGPYLTALRAAHGRGEFNHVCGECRERDTWLG